MAPLAYYYHVVLGVYNRMDAQSHSTHLHGASLLIWASLGCHLKAVRHPSLWGPVGGRQLLHEFLQAEDPVVGPEGLQLKVLLVGHMELWEKERKSGGPARSCMRDISKAIYSRTHMRTKTVKRPPS